MKKTIAAILTVILALSGIMTAGADTVLNLFYESGMELLFETSNVTLTGKAEFFLDGERFKTAEVLYIQDYDNSKFQLDLYTPRRDGAEGEDRHSGYTVYANGEDIYVTEVFYPGMYKTGSTGVQGTILRKTVQMELVSLATEGTAKELKISLNRDVPETVNAALNLFYQFIAKRYFRTDYDQVSVRHMIPMASYITVAQGILGSTEQVSLKKAEITAKRDDAGRLEQVKGDVSLMLTTGRDGTRQLDISFSLDVSDFDGSHVGLFDPEKEGLKLNR